MVALVVVLALALVVVLFVVALPLPQGPLVVASAAAVLVGCRLEFWARADW